MAVSAWIRALPAQTRGRRDDVGATRGTPISVPVLVDATGRRGKVVRATGLIVSLGSLALLATLPLSLVLPEHVQTSIDPATAPVRSASMQGVLYVDHDCDGAHGRDEPTIGAMQVALVHDGVVVATTRADSAGKFAFAHVAADAGYEIRLSEPATADEQGATAPAPVGFPVSTTAGPNRMAFGLPQAGTACGASARTVPGDPGSGDDAAPRSVGN